MDRIQIYLFGPPHIESAGKIIDILLRKALALFAYLAATGKSHTRDALATLLWPEAGQKAGRANLRRALYNLKKIIGDQVLAVSSERIGIDSKANLWIDVHAFQNHAGAHTSPDSTENRYASLSEAAHLFCGDFLAGFNLLDCPEFDEWQFFQREHYQQLGLQVLDRLAEADTKEGRFQQAISLARRRLSFDRLHEPTHRRLMQLYSQVGEYAAAVRQFKECRRILSAEWSATPQPETVHLFNTIRSSRQAGRFGETPSAPKTRYVKSGGAYIAYQTIGQGPVDILFVAGFVSHIEHLWKEPRLASFFHQVGKFARIILFDRRGIGLSDRIGDPPSVEKTLDDIHAVLEAAASRHTFLFGASEGGPAVMQYAVKHSARILGIVLYGTMAKGTKSNNYPFALTRSQYDKWLELLVSSWGNPSGIEYFAPSAKGDPQMRQWWASMLRLSSSPGNVRLVLESLRDIDVRSLLPRIEIPALILHRKQDRAVRVDAGRYLSKHIPRSRYVELDGHDHWWWVGDADAIVKQLKDFTQNPAR